MEAGRKTTLAYVAVVVLAVAAGALYFAYQQRGEEGERIAAALLAASSERDALRGERDTLGNKAQAELERTRKSFEEVQSVIARLTGARGIYTVQNADSLSTIAAFFYRDGLRWPDIFKANAHLIDHPDLIYPEQVLIVSH